MDEARVRASGGARGRVTRAALIRSVARRGATPRLQRLALLIYESVARAVAIWLRRGMRATSVYVRASLGARDVTWGHSDIDMVVVVPDTDSAGDSDASPLRKRIRALNRVPLLRHVMAVAVYDRSTLDAALSQNCLTAPGGATLLAIPQSDELSLRVRPGLYGGPHEWRRLGGPDAVSVAPTRSADDQRLAAWLELQYWWRHAFRAAIEPDRREATYLCGKLIVEAARVWLWVLHGEIPGDRGAVLERALSRAAEEPGLVQAGALRESLARPGRPPVGEALGWLVRVTSEVAQRIAEEIEPAGTSEVRLLWGSPEELVVEAGAPRDRLLPLVDWRARAAPPLPDETFAIVPGDPADPAAIAAAAAAAGPGDYRVLLGHGLIVLPTRDFYTAGLLRSVQCAPSDPVSHALIREARTAGFPEVGGWSARDSARRAVAEHRAWLARSRARPAADAWAMGRLFTAARAALFAESVEAGEAELALSVAAIGERLGDRDAGCRGTVEEAIGAYRLGRPDPERTIPGGAVAGLQEVVLGLPAYAT